jgi:regulatory protein
VKLSSSSQDVFKRVELAAVRLLARREHSTEELKRKLQGKGHPCDVVAAVIQKLGSKRLVSDDRFVTSFVRHRAMRGQGPVRIRAELRQQGIADARIQQELDHLAPAVREHQNRLGDLPEAESGALSGDDGSERDWGRLAAQVRQRKFGARPRSPAERAKQVRFLQYRGFTADQIRTALDADLDASDEDPVHPSHPGRARIDADEADPDWDWE